jgi:hypothetical protein
MKAIITSSVLAVGLALCLPFALAKEKKHEEQSISSTDVPAAVQKAAEAEAKGGTIVKKTANKLPSRWMQMAKS